MPVVTTLMARGAFPDSHDQHLGMPGMHGMYTAVTAMQKADLLISLGARFDDRVTGQDLDLRRRRQDHPRRHRPRGVQQGPSRRRRAPDQRRHGAARARRDAQAMPLNLDVWWKEIRTWQERYPLVYDEPARRRVHSVPST